MEQRLPAAPTASPVIVETDIPARLDRLPWSRFHTLVVAALGITWILDGLEVTLAGHLHDGSTLTRCREDSGSESSSQTR